MARELGIARNTVKQYLRGGAAALVQVRPEARALDAAQRARAGALVDEVATGNAVVVHRELVRAGAEASVRTVQRVVVDRRREEHAAAVATVRGDHAHLDHRNRAIAIAETGGSRSNVPRGR